MAATAAAMATDDSGRADMWAAHVSTAPKKTSLPLRAARCVLAQASRAASSPRSMASASTGTTDSESRFAGTSDALASGAVSPSIRGVSDMNVLSIAFPLRGLELSIGGANSRRMWQRQFTSRPRLPMSDIAATLRQFAAIPSTPRIAAAMVTASCQSLNRLFLISQTSRLNS